MKLLNLFTIKASKARSLSNFQTVSISALLFLSLGLGACATENRVLNSSAVLSADSDITQQMQAVKAASEQSELSYEIVRSLTVEVGPRIAGSAGDKVAVAWAEEELKTLGFDRVYKQPVRVRNWERGFADAKITAPFTQPLVITALGGSIATPEDGLKAKLLMFEDLSALAQAKKEDVSGNIVFLNTRMQRDRAGRFYGKVVPNRVNGAVEAAKLGASAVIIRSVGTDNSRFAHTGIMRYADEVPKIPAGAISTADADNLEAMFTKTAISGEDIILSLNMQAKDAGWQTSYNVIGEFTGSERPEEVVLISAHLDSWDEGTGALDDGAGVGIVTAAAKLIKDTLGQPKRTIRVVLYAAEEIGLVGAYQYARTNKNDLENIIMAAESDFGAGQIYQIDTRFNPVVRDAPTALYDALAQMGITLGNNTTNGGPDVSMLPSYGVPVVALKQDGTYYFDYHHTPNDTLDKIAMEDIVQNQTVWAMLTAFMANTDYDPRPAPTKAAAPSASKMTSKQMTQAATMHLEALAGASGIGPRIAGTDSERQAADYIKAQFARLGYNTSLQSFDYVNRDTKNEESSQNVIAYKPGRSGKSIIVGAHYDSTSADKGSLGAVDNAASIAVILALAESLANSPEQEHGIKFLAFGAEEVGLVGAYEFVAKASPDELANYIGMINLDGIVGSDYLYIHSAHSTPYTCKGNTTNYAHSPKLREALFEIAQDKTAQDSFLIHPGFDGYPSGETGGWSDHAPFACAGIPIGNFESTNFKINGRSGQDGYSQSTHPALWNCFDEKGLGACDRESETKWGMIWHTGNDRLDVLNRLFPNRIEQQLELNLIVLDAFLRDIDQYAEKR